MTHDLLVIGGGAAGMAAARTAVRLRKRAALVQDGPIGGDCTFTGCVPSKTLIEASHQGLEFEQALQRVHSTVASIASTETADVLRSEGIDVLEGCAVLSGSGALWVGDRQVQATRTVLAMGTEPMIPDLPELADGPLPDQRHSVGPDVTSSKHRCARRRCDRLLAKEEHEGSAVITEGFARGGIEVRTGATVVGVRHPRPSLVQVDLQGGASVDGAALLVAVGRSPNTPTWAWRLPRFTLMSVASCPLTTGCGPRREGCTRPRPWPGGCNSRTSQMRWAELRLSMRFEARYGSGSDRRRFRGSFHYTGGRAGGDDRGGSRQSRRAGRLPADERS